MNDRRRHDDSRAEGAPHSRLFVVCDKTLTEKDIEEAFSPFGDIVRLFMPKDQVTGERKGVAYVSYSKTSEAAKALSEMTCKKLGSQGRPVKVMIASNKEDDGEIIEANLRRLFVISKTAMEKELSDYFSQFGTVESVHLLTKEENRKLKGVAFVTFDSFMSAARAYEDCDKSYKAIFAKPREGLKRRSKPDGGYNDPKCPRPLADRDYQSHHGRFSLPFASKNDPDDFRSVKVKFNTKLSRQHIIKLFNVIPGMVECDCMYDGMSGCAIVTYDNHTSAAHAVRRLDQFEYPLGDTISVVPQNLLNKVATDLTNIVQSFKEAMTSGNGVPDFQGLAEAMSQASSLLKTASTSTPAPELDSRLTECDRLCNVKLPPPQPRASSHVDWVKRCFIVCVPEPLPSDILYDVFGRFGDLRNVYILPHKNFGFANYITESAAENAKKTLHGAYIGNVMLKVLDAEEKCERQ